MTVVRSSSSRPETVRRGIVGQDIGQSLGGVAAGHHAGAAVIFAALRQSGISDGLAL